jgi:alkaline phosphatase D
MHRRAFLASSIALAACRHAEGPSPHVQPVRKGAPPKLPLGLQIGDVTDGRAVVWSRADRKSQMVVGWTAGSIRRVELGPTVDADSDYCGVVELEGIPPASIVKLDVSFVGEAESEKLTGSFRTGDSAGDVFFAWSGDLCGQGYGIDPERGGLRVFEAMRKEGPHFFVNSGDVIYADNPILATTTGPEGTVFHNVVVDEKKKVAETLAEFRGAFGYHLLDEHVRKFHREVPLVVQWDDHEIHNNWYPGQTLKDPRYVQENKVPILAQRARRAFFEYTPIRRSATHTIQRVIKRGLVDVFVLDARSFRGPNGKNLEKNASEVTAFLGDTQLDWLKQELAASKATWKVIACDQPVGLVIGDGWEDGVQKHEGWANGDPGEPRGREHEMAKLLRFLESKKIKNIVFITADVHYVAAHEYAAERGKIGPFPTFWEFVAGPLHAGGFGPSPMDATFGGKVVFQRVPPIMNQPPINEWPSFGSVHVDNKSLAMTVRLHDGLGGVLFEKILDPT